MIKTPCELALWQFLPALRRELVKEMVNRGMERKRVAGIFGMSEAAICQYLKSRRGSGSAARSIHSGFVEWKRGEDGGADRAVRREDSEIREEGDRDIRALQDMLPYGEMQEVRR